jgi:hypothetical protein
MVVPTEAPSHNSCSRYPTIERSEMSDAQTPNNGMIQNLNSNFNAVRLQTIMESIQRMAPEGSPVVALAQQGVEAVNYVIAQRSADNPRGEPSVDKRSNDRAKQTQSEAAALASGNRRLADNDAHRWITQNRQMREYNRDHDDLRNIIDDRRRLRARSPTSPHCSPVRDVTPSGRAVFMLLLHHSSKSSGRKNSRLGTLTSMTDPTILIYSSRSIIQSSRMWEETIR